MKVGFYPCCAQDVLEPLIRLMGMIDLLVLCDLNPAVARYMQPHKVNLEGLPQIRFECGDAWEVIRRLERIDVLFYRRDSGGEGGSGVPVISKAYLEQFVQRLPPEGGWLFTDGSNERNNAFRTMTRSRGLLLGGWRLRAEPPGKPQRGELVKIQVQRESEDSRR